ncbi:GNAT family N-acetyltransferase [Candidatus Hydrogenedentota bacterium]
MEITNIAEEDLAELAELYQQLQANKPSVEKMRETLLRVGEDSNHVMLGARIDGQLVGTLLGVACQMLFGQCKSFMVVEDVVVSNDYRRRGVGRALMREIEERAAQLNCSYVMLITDHDRLGAHGFYESLGYKTDAYKAFKKSIL